MIDSSTIPDLRIDPEFRDLIPPLSADERKGLEKSILEEGVRDPIVVWDGIIVDGHNRYEIASGKNEDGVILPLKEPVERTFESRDAAKVWIIENQLEQRRNLSDADKIDLAETKREIIEASQPRGGRPPAEPQGESLLDGKPDQNSSPVSEPKHKRNTDAKIGKAAGVSSDTVRKYRYIKGSGDARIIDGLRVKEYSMDNAFHLARVARECGPETYEVLWEQDAEDAKVRYSTPQLKHLLKLASTDNGDAVTADLVELVETGQPDVNSGKPVASVHKAHEIRERERKEAERERKREENRALVTESRFPEPGETFSTVVLDPPWDWGDEGDVDQFGRGKPTYSTMSIDEIAALPVSKLAADNAHIYLWITNRSLPKGFRLLEEWGFRYITALTWVKPSFGMGNYFRGSTEHVLFGVRGSLPLESRSLGTHFEAPRPGKHSAKPPEFYEMVETASPGPWLEMFARTDRPGWKVWGAEV